MSRQVLFACLLAMAGATKLSEMDNGAEFTKCISITDFQQKTLSDDITLIDRESGGCCPKGSVPGQKWYNNYKGAQVVCGFKADGSVALSTGSSGGAKTCTYNKCYVDKQDLTCADDSKQFLNGCCKGTTKANTGFPAQCKNYYYSFNNVYSEKVQYCLTYDKDYGTKGRAGTSDKTDDQAGGKLVPSKISTYTPCGTAGGSGGSPSPSPSPTPASSTTSSTSGAVQVSATLSMVAASIFFAW